MSDGPEQPSTRALVGSAIVFYGLMSVLGLWLMGFDDMPVAERVFGTAAGPDGTDHTLRDTGIGAAAGLAVVLITFLTRNLAPVRKLSEELASVLGRPGTGAIAVLAVTSAIGEELFFRGALQSLIGFWPTVLIFGLVHGGTAKRFRMWAIFATLAGVLLGWLTVYTGNLLAATLCHMTVNYWNLHALADALPARTD